MTDHETELKWTAVELLVLIAADGTRFARIFERHPTLTYNEYWMTRGGKIRFVGVNEPPASGPRLRVSGEAARTTAARFCAGLDDYAETGATLSATDEEPAKTDARLLERVTTTRLPEAKAEYAAWLTARGDIRGEIIRLAESVSEANLNEPERNAMLRRLHELAIDIPIYSDLEFWIITMGYWEECKKWKSPLAGRPRPPQLDDDRTDPNPPILFSDRAAKVLRLRAAELQIELNAEAFLRVEIYAVQETSFACGYRFDLNVDSDRDLVFWSKGVHVAVGKEVVDVGTGMELAYFDGVVSVRQRACRRTPAIESVARAISAYSVPDPKDNPDWKLRSLNGSASRPPSTLRAE